MVEAYTPTLAHFGALAGDRAIHEVAARDIEKYLGDWFDDFEAAHGRAPSLSTQRNRLQAIRSFYAWADRLDYLEDAEGRPLRNPT